MPTKKSMKKETVKLQPPWVTHYNKVKALFEEDSDIKDIVLKDGDANIKEIIIYVNNESKAYAINELIKSEINMGNITMKIYAVCPNTKENLKPIDIINIAFKGNPNFKNVIDVKTPIGELTYAVFTKKVIQFFNDDLTDAWGNYNGLPANIAKDLLDEKKLNMINICTDGQ